jgi:ATP-dependent Clp protease ATP-binding subunit ClpC
MMRQDRFTEQAQEVLRASQELVRQHRHTQWDVEHVFLALLSQPEGLARRIFERLNVPVEQMTRRVADFLGQAPKAGMDVVQIYTTPRIVRMLEMANAEAERLKDEFVGVEHLLIAIADEREGESARILRDYQVDKERIVTIRRSSATAST